MPRLYQRRAARNAFLASAADVLLDQLKGIYASRPDNKVMYFRAHRELKFDKVQDAVEIARRAGVRVMAAISEIEQKGGIFGALDKDKKK